MADISAWSPVDESNTAAPPNGWPENMQPSAVNNSARALMGGVRRWYDTITAQITDIYGRFANYMPISGGTFTGPITAPQMTSTGTLSATGNITSSGTITGNQITSTGNINATGNVSAGVDVVAGRNIGATGTVYGVAMECSGRINGAYYDCDGVRVIDTSAGNPLIYKAGGGVAIQLQSGATYYDNNAHNFRNTSASNTFTIDASGNVNATAQLQGASLYSRGNIDAAGTISASGNIYATGAVDGAYVQSRGDAGIAGLLTVPRINMSGALTTSNWIVPTADNGSNVGLPGLNFNAMFAYAFVVPSDGRLKGDVKNAEGGLAMVRAVAAKTYSLPAAPDPARRHWGLLAQEVAEASRGRDFGGHVVGDEGQQGLAVNELVAVLWGACREMARRIEVLEEAAHAR